MQERDLMELMGTMVLMVPQVLTDRAEIMMTKHPEAEAEMVGTELVLQTEEQVEREAQP
jgi:hypothetical protein